MSRSRPKENKNIRELFYLHEGNLIHKWDHYLDIYNDFFSEYRNKEIILVEFGVSHGGSLQLWREYFGKKAHIIGIDINPECKQFESKNTEIIIGDQDDSKFLKRLSEVIKSADIIIDDGGHTTTQQIKTFNSMFPIVKEGGIYLVEDLHTNYWKHRIKCFNLLSSGMTTIVNYYVSRFNDL